jgi:hypothetical protein
LKQMIAKVDQQIAAAKHALESEREQPR